MAKRVDVDGKPSRHGWQREQTQMAKRVDVDAKGSRRLWQTMYIINTRKGYINNKLYLNIPAYL